MGGGGGLAAASPNSVCGVCGGRPRAGRGRGNAPPYGSGGLPSRAMMVKRQRYGTNRWDRPRKEESKRGEEGGGADGWAGGGRESGEEEEEGGGQVPVPARVPPTATVLVIQGHMGRGGEGGGASTPRRGRPAHGHGIGARRDGSGDTQ